MFTIELGSKVKSRSTGLMGLITSRSESLYGCNRYTVQPPCGKDMKLPDSYYCDEADLEVTEKPKIERQNSTRGGPITRAPGSKA